METHWDYFKRENLESFECIKHQDESKEENGDLNEFYLVSELKSVFEKSPFITVTASVLVDEN